MAALFTKCACFHRARLVESAVKLPIRGTPPVPNIAHSCAATG
jgi:hypothetical protein